MKKIVLAGLLLLVLACDKLITPTSPSYVYSTNSNPALSAWSPCVVIHTPAGPPENAQIEAMRKLRMAGRLSWVRFGANNNGTGKMYYQAAKSMGLKIMSIIATDDLIEAPSWESGFDRIHALYPETDIWEIGGEISNPHINRHLMTPEEYMTKFKGLYEYTQKRYPGLALVSGPTFGSASTREFRGGPAEFERLLQLGLAKLNVIIAVNVYSENALYQYSSIFDRYSSEMKNNKVWVTESGTTNTHQEQWVAETYPKIHHTLRPEMICWYVMWDGDNTNDGLIHGIMQPPYQESDLFKALTRSVR